MLTSALVLLLTATSVPASDWPTYRHDLARTGCTNESLGAPLTLQWVYTSSHTPRPAWSGPGTRPREGFLLHNRVDFDDAFQVVVAGDRLYFGSSADDKVYALSAATGEELWSFFTGGPIRLAPTCVAGILPANRGRDALDTGRLFVGSDDGFVYCLKADSGELVWKVRGGPAEERLLGNGCMISRWPIRSGVLVDDGVAYFGAGVFPHENVYLVAVRAEDGKVVWRDDSISEGDAYQNEFSPQGYMLATATRLFVPSGRALPVAFEKATGQLAFNRKYGWRGEEAGGNIGGTYALLVDNQIYTGSEDHLVTLDQQTGRTGFAWFPGRRLTVAGNMSYLATGKEILAMDRTAYAEASRRRNALEFRVRTLRTQLSTATAGERPKIQEDIKLATQDLAQHNREKVEPTVKWRAACPHDAELIVCENLVLAGGQDEVCAFNRQSGECGWKAAVEGNARSLVVANGHLYVSTDKGRIYAFTPGQTEESESRRVEGVPPSKRGQDARDTGRVVRHSKPSVSDPYPQDALTPIYRAAAEAIVMESGVTKGYCLVLGAEQGRLALELARRTNLQIVGIEPDPAKVQAARKAFDAAGLYGTRVAIDQGDPSALPYSDYFANLIVSDSLLLTGKIPGDATQLARHLKPCGGVICLGMAAGRVAPPPSGVVSRVEGVPPSNRGQDARDTAISAGDLADWLSQLRLGRCRISQTNGLWATLKRGPLPGAGQWTHQYANAGNVTCSNDKIVSGPLGLLWFGEPGPAPMVNRHDAAAAPLVVNGKTFIQGENTVMAQDSYNGTLLWQRDIPGAVRTRLKAKECGNLAASDDSFFVALPDRCLRLDAETGKTLATYPLPTKTDDKSPQWGFLAYVDGILYGSAMTRVGVSNRVFAIDSRSGEFVWQYEAGNIGNLTLALGDGWLFFIDSSLTREQRDELLRQDKSRLASLKGEEARQAEAAVKKLDLRLAVALDARTGGKLWETPVDVTDCSNLGIGGGDLMAIYNDGVLLLAGANANGHYWKQFLAGQFSERRLVALSGRTGKKLWARDANYRHRPIVIGDMIVAEPWAYDLKTGQQRTRPNPISGVEAPWQFLRPGHHCTALSACPQMILMRSGFTAYYDLHDDSGIRHFAGHRPGCWINTIPADGLVLQPEASAGCLCLFPIECSIALEPRPDHYRWGIYSAKGSNTPVQQLAVNLGASGDMRARGMGLGSPTRDSALGVPFQPMNHRHPADATTNRGQDARDTVLWLAYPRPRLPADRAAMGFTLDLKVEFFAGGEYVSQASLPPTATGLNCPVRSSFARGIKRCTLPLRGDADGPAEYTIRLYFPPVPESEKSKATFDIRLQGNVVAKAFDPGQSEQGASLELTGIRVDRNLEIEFVRADEKVMPVLGGFEAICTSPAAGAKTK